MNHLRRVGTSIVVAIFAVGIVTVSAPVANAADGASSASKIQSSFSTDRRRDSGWN